MPSVAWPASYSLVSIVLVSSLLCSAITMLVFRKGWRRALRFFWKTQRTGVGTRLLQALSRSTVGGFLVKPPAMAPARIRLTNLGAHSATLSFRERASQSRFVTRYRFEVALRGRNAREEFQDEAVPRDADGFWTACEGPSGSVRLKDLFDDHGYHVRVRMRNAAGAGPWSKALAFFTKQEANRWSGGLFSPLRHGDRLAAAADGGAPEGTAAYQWSQDRSTVCLRLELPEDIRRGRQLAVTIAPSRLRVARSDSGEVLLAGRLSAVVKADESTWELEEVRAGGCCFFATLAKMEEDDHRHQHRWSALLRGHPAVDFQHVAEGAAQREPAGR